MAENYVDLKRLIYDKKKYLDCCFLVKEMELDDGIDYDEKENAVLSALNEDYYLVLLSANEFRREYMANTDFTYAKRFAMSEQSIVFFNHFEDVFSDSFFRTDVYVYGIDKTNERISREYFEEERDSSKTIVLVSKNNCSVEKFIKMCENNIFDNAVLIDIITSIESIQILKFYANSLLDCQIKEIAQKTIEKPTKYHQTKQ